MSLVGRIEKKQYLIIMQIQDIQFGQVLQAAYLVDSGKYQEEMTFKKKKKK